jgi:transcriptional regulator with XRE-family HTH domain
MSLGERLKRARLSRGLTQKEVARRAEICENAYYRYEHNTTEPSFFVACLLSSVLDVSLDYLAGRSDM